MNERDYVKNLLALGGQMVLERLGEDSGELSFNKAKTTYGSWFMKAVEAGDLKPVRKGEGKRGKIVFRRADILALRAAQSRPAELVL
nr:hypothetical protein [Schwartzia sp. (in: firmicutes)]